MNNKVKENTLVKRISPAGTECVARVRWVNEKGEVGVTYLSPDSFKGSAQVVEIEELEVIQNDIQGDTGDQHKHRDAIPAVKLHNGGYINTSKHKRQKIDG